MTVVYNSRLDTEELRKEGRAEARRDDGWMNVRKWGTREVENYLYSTFHTQWQFKVLTVSIKAFIHIHHNKKNKYKRVKNHL